MGCCHCKYLSEGKRKAGEVDGALYYCSKKKEYVNGNDYSCEDFYKDMVELQVLSMIYIMMVEILVIMIKIQLLI